MNSNNKANDSEEAKATGDGAGAGNVAIVNAPTEPSVAVAEGSAGANNDNDNEREQSSSSSLHRNQVQHQHQQEEEEQQGQGEEATDSVTSASARATTRPDAFQIYSDDDTRMQELLGLEAPANPNDAGEQQVNWRQLVGLSAAGQERRRRDVNTENGGTPRRTRLSYELHPAVFAEMWFGPGGEFDLNDGAVRNDVLAARRGQGGRQD